MEMRSVLSWKEEVEQALEKLLDVVRPKGVTPAPGHVGLHRRDGNGHV
jgi:hypothetical protein